MAHTFHLLVVGCGGGPSETNLSSYLLKPANKTWAQGVIALEAGSGIGATKKIMRKHPEMFGQMTTVDLYSYIRGFLVTHGHLDHVSGLVLSAGAMKGPRKRIWSTKDTLKDLETGVFSDRLWPNLASWKESDPAFMLLYTALPLTTYHPLGCNMSVRTMPVSHGTNALGTYTSAAFFVRHDPSSKEFLFFGDVEPDSLAATPLTHRVWLEAAPKIAAGSLSAIFLECSWPSGRPDSLLYGHLTPEHFTHELCVLASEVVRLSQPQNGGHEGPARKLRRASIPAILARNRKRIDAPASPVMENIQGALAGVQIFVTHCKDDLEEKFEESIQQVVAGQIRALVDQAGLGCKIVAVEQGALLSF